MAISQRNMINKISSSFFQRDVDSSIIKHKYLTKNPDLNIGDKMDNMPYPGYLLQNYCEDPAVYMVQQTLQALGYSIAADGAFGPVTENAVRNFQLANGLVADGIVGPNTWYTLMGPGC